MGTWIAAPVAATMLADFGADVIKVEPPGGDAYRRYPLSAAAPKAAENYVWIVDARNKRSISLDLRTPAGRDVLERLIRQCDIYITNQPFTTRRALRLNYEDIAPLNERMIYASLTAYGEEGPDIDGEGFDAVAWWARSGLMDLVRAPGAAPVWWVPGGGDHPTAVSLFASILMALIRRERTGKGGKVHTSLLANGIWANAIYAQAAISGADFHDVWYPAPAPSRTIYETADGRYLQLYMVRTREAVDRLLLALDRTDLIAADLLASPEGIGALVEELTVMFRSHEAAHWAALFREHKVPAAVVARVEDLADDPQTIVNGMLVPPVDPNVPVPLVVNHPLHVDGLATVGPTAPPGIGEHADQILAELGYNAAEIAAMREAGVV